MSRTALSREEFRLELAYAFGEGIDPIAHLRRVSGWQEAADE